VGLVGNRMLEFAYSYQVVYAGIQSYYTQEHAVITLLPHLSEILTCSCILEIGKERFLFEKKS